VREGGVDRGPGIALTVPGEFGTTAACRSGRGLEKYQFFASETPSIFRGLFIRGKDIDLGSKIGSSFVLLLFRSRNEDYFPSQKNQILDGCLAPKNMSCFVWVWRQNITPSGKVFRSVFPVAGKIFPKEKTCLDVVFCSQKSIGHSCATTAGIHCPEDSSVRPSCRIFSSA
jgi:hypothetical protein